ncbi:MAG TPA: PDZ domain-containing protein [Phycicoccus sp.]|nr:PDZ domain-containing protein [Phycicoccus sp.]
MGGLLMGVFLSVAAAAGLVFVPLPYAVMIPGPVTDTLGSLEGERIVDVSGTETYPTEGSLFFTTVRVRGGPDQRITVYDVLGAWLDPSSEVRPVEDFYPKGSTKEQVQDEGAAEMENSQQVAAAVAARALGQDVTVVVEVAGVQEGSAAAGLIEKGDEIVSVDGKPATSPAVVRAAVRAHAVGDAVPIVLRRAGSEVSVAPVAKDNAGTPVIGVLMTGKYTLPLDVTIHAGAVGGPSAGLMFSLAIYDLATPGALTGGAKVAGTGTIADDGTVGPIGGIAQKMAGAKAGGATWFLAPADNCTEVVGHIPDGLQVVRVDTFATAEKAVTAIAADEAQDLPRCAP